MLKILKNKKGITLIELLVGMLLFAIAVAATSAILAPMLRAYERANDFAECNTLLDNIANQIIKDLSESTVPLEESDASYSVSLSVNVTAINGNSIIINTPNVVEYSISGDGILLRNGDPVLSKIYYKNMSVAFKVDSITENQEYMLTVSVFSHRDDSEMMQRNYAVSPICLNQY